MGIFLKEQSSNIEWIIWEVNESIDELLGLVSDSKFSNKLDSIKSEKRKKELLCSRVLLQELFGQYIHVDYDEFGSPIINSSDWNISITHSGKYVSVARSRFPLGVDIEIISEKLDRTKHKFSSDTELNCIDMDQKLYHLALYWSGKESVYKLVGNEALIFDTEMKIENFTPKNKGIFKLQLDSSESKKLIEVQYRRLDEYVFTFCVSE